MTRAARPSPPAARAPVAAALAAAVALAACTSDHVLGGDESDEKSRCAPRDWPLAAGVHARTIKHAGVERSYTVALPEGYDPCELTPVLVVLRAEEPFLTEQLAPGSSELLDRARERGQILVLPRATRAGDQERWNAPLAPAAVAGVNDVDFVSRVLDSIPGRDPARTYLLGHGNGGTFAHTLAARLLAFTAVAVVAGTLGGHTDASSPLWLPPDPAAPLPALLIHGRDDAVLPHDGGTVDGQQILSLADAVAFWTHADGCAGPPFTSATADAETALYKCPGGRRVLAVSLPGVGHSWLAEDAATRALTADLIFNFLDRFPP